MIITKMQLCVEKMEHTSITSPRGKNRRRKQSNVLPLKNNQVKTLKARREKQEQNLERESRNMWNSTITVVN